MFSLLQLSLLVLQRYKKTVTDEMVPDIVWFELDSLHWSKIPVPHVCPYRPCHSWCRGQQDTLRTSRSRTLPGHSRRRPHGTGFLEASAEISGLRCWVLISSIYPAMFTARTGGALRIVFQLARDWAAARVTLASRLESELKLFCYWIENILTSDPQSQSSFSSITPLPQVP